MDALVSQEGLDHATMWRAMRLLLDRLNSTLNSATAMDDCLDTVVELLGADRGLIVDYQNAWFHALSVGNNRCEQALIGNGIVDKRRHRLATCQSHDDLLIDRGGRRGVAIDFNDNLTRPKSSETRRTGRIHVDDHNSVDAVRQ